MPNLAHTRPSEVMAASVAVSNDSVGAALARVAHLTPDAPALHWLTPSGVDSLTWGQLYERASGAARRLRELDGRDGRVALVAGNCVEWIVAMFGAALVGRPVVPISPVSTEAELIHMLTLSQADTVLVMERADGGGSTQAGLTGSVRRLPRRPAVFDMAEFTGSVADFVKPAAIDAGAEFLLQFTSGTTGVPKAAVLSHRAALNAARFYALGCTAQTGEVWLNPLPLYHVGGSISGLLVAMSHSGAYIVVDRFSTASALRAIREIRPALVGLVPTMIIDLMRSHQISTSDFDSVRLVMGGATAVDPVLIAEMEHRLDITFMVAYGQSEAPMMTVSSPDDSPAVRTRSLGRCLPGRDYRLCDKRGDVVALGEVGELCVRGPLTMTGYLRSDGSVDPATDGEGWRQTGDLCSMDTDGVLTFHGRIREVIIRGGLNVFPAEVEQVLCAHETVSEAAVFGVHDQRLGERVVAAILPVAGAEVDLDGVRELARDRLSRYKRPAEWIVVATLPRTSTGKVRKHRLREWYEIGTLRSECAGPGV